MADIMSQKIVILKGMEEMSDFIVNKWIQISGREIKNKGVFTVALSGGKTPLTLFRKLSGHTSLPWNKTHVFLVDERFVPYESEENNYHMINRTLLRHVNIPAKNVHPIFTSELSPQTSAAKYEEDLSSFFKSSYKNLPRFDLVLLGIGEDGHTASLFPGSPALKERKRLAVAVTPSDAAKKERITMTLPVINNSENIIILAAGEKKTAAIKKVVENKKGSLPAALVKPRNGNLIFLLDESAGLFLKKV